MRPHREFITLTPQTKVPMRRRDRLARLLRDLSTLSCSFWFAVGVGLLAGLLVVGLWVLILLPAAWRVWWEG